MMAKQVNRGRVNLPFHRCFEFEHVVVIRARPANSRDPGYCLRKVRMYGRKLYPARRHELRAWQTGGVHVCHERAPCLLSAQCFIKDEGWPLEVGLQ